ncbi:hypothetical protein [Prescottella equi]|uniref:hypothetical protein n=1 Tax=Rhodococcus hoagii TaxID=43767 RepID=UPI0003140009|nr:hypothetical protein [Prescottella equi]AVP70722.1 hypothetical protein C7H75_23975 [Prescottella equi]MBM4483604.1 hypothetical protein [Prescottella equi]MBM4519997.1 hypothetical protein [Prescottella equi]MBM4529413.1 hypothetical protein [Prescottella equi]MBM4534411.1 hypothetical protein [Prescottella equi]
MPSGKPSRGRQSLEMLIGILGFFTFMAFLAAVVPIVRGEPSATASLILLGCVAVLAGALVFHRRI